MNLISRFVAGTKVLTRRIFVLVKEIACPVAYPVDWIKFICASCVTRLRRVAPLHNFDFRTCTQGISGDLKDIEPKTGSESIIPEVVGAVNDVPDRCVSGA